MRNLLSAEFYRYKHSRLFWLLMCAAVLSGAVYGITAFDGVFDDMFVVPLFVIPAVFISLSLGREYADGTIRNKIIAGKKKTSIFLSKLTVNVIASVMMVLAFLIPCIAILSVNVLSKIPFSILLWTLLGFLLLNISWAVIFTFVSSLISSREIGAIVNFILIIAIMFASYQLEFAIGQPEFLYTEESTAVPMNQEEVEQVRNNTFSGSYGVEDNEDGTVTYYKYVITDTAESPNPKYIKEPYNCILQGLDSMFPHGQVNEYVACLTAHAQDYDAPEYDSRIRAFPLYSLSLICILSGTGMLLFKKKEVK